MEKIIIARCSTNNKQDVTRQSQELISSTVDNILSKIHLL
jgi:hypothetical protein